MPDKRKRCEECGTLITKYNSADGNLCDDCYDAGAFSEALVVIHLGRVEHVFVNATVEQVENFIVEEAWLGDEVESREMFLSEYDITTIKTEDLGNKVLPSEVNYDDIEKHVRIMAEQRRLNPEAIDVYLSELEELLDETYKDVTSDFLEEDFREYCEAAGLKADRD